MARNDTEHQRRHREFQPFKCIAMTPKPIISHRSVTLLRIDSAPMKQ